MKKPTFSCTPKESLSWLLAVASGVLLFASFPPIGADALAFVALIPFCWALYLQPTAPLRLGYLTGLVFWIPSLWFLSPVTIPGALTLAAYCALYWIPLAWGWGALLQAPDRMTFKGSLRCVVVGAAWWCLLEWIRSWFLTGFPWNEMAVTQWQNYSLIQLASIGGTSVISFLVVLMNLGLAFSLLGMISGGRLQRPKRNHPELYLPILLLALSFQWGFLQLNEHGPEGIQWKKHVITAIQPLSENKWSVELAQDNFRVLWELTDAAMSLNPDLVIWPETATPEELRYSPTANAMIQTLSDHEVPLLVGSLDFEYEPTETQALNRIYYNSSFLVNAQGELVQEYRKQHLVMFGEYMPLANIFPFLRSLTPMPEDVTPGEGSGVLQLQDPDLTLGMLICFEDLLPHKAQERVLEGADVFVNQTNDAWFDPLWGSEAHMAHAVFRSVEQRRPTVRATNSGVSGWIDVRGIVRDELRDPQTGRVQIRGSIPLLVEVAPSPEQTFYTQRPWVFPAAWVLLSIPLFVPLVKKRNS